MLKNIPYMKIFNGKKESQKILNNLKRNIKQEHLKPGLAVFLIGRNKSSELYVKLKKKAAEDIGIKFNLFKYSGNTKQGEIIKKIKALNKDDSIHGIIVQLPLPKGFDTDRVISNIDPQKDADGFHKKNLKNLPKVEPLSKGSTFGRRQIAPVLPKVILNIFNIFTKDRPSQKKIRALVKSKIFGDTLKAYFKLNGFKLEFLVISRTDIDDVKRFTQDADVLISVLGQSNFIKADMIKNGVILIDAGVSKKGNRIFGDVDRESVSKKASFLTPVPGGVGPMTVAFLMENIYNACHNSLGS